METLQNMLEDVWNSQEGKVCSLVSWERFSSLQQAQVLKVLKVHVECCQYTVFLTLCVSAVGHMRTHFPQTHSNNCLTSLPSLAHPSLTD